MPALTRCLGLAALTVALTGLGTFPATAGGFDAVGSQQKKTSGDSSGPALESRVSITVKGTKAKGSGPITSTAVDWEPPACWYEPYWKAKDFKTFNEAKWSMYESAGGEPEGIADVQARYKKGHPYNDFNVAKNDEGMWWVAVKNPEMKDDPAANTCTRDPFWVDNGENPGVPQAIDTETLAGLAHQRTVVPPTEISVAPNGKSTVNAPTWVWLDKGAFKPVSVTASLPGTGLWATTTAKPVSLHLDPGTADAETLPASGECLINDDGSIGEPYARGKGELTPPCGVRYLRSSGDDTYGLEATLTWEITWEGAGGTGGDLPNGTFATTTEVPVQEIQSVNR
ncbi:hypothetical protein ACFY8N_18775 [Streptomyces collinus]|uniref:hypothetical protein n=1 Tax=Streptomyces collinus TaxID=42684 RepID=UPI00367C62EB